MKKVLAKVCFLGYTIGYRRNFLAGFPKRVCIGKNNFKSGKGWEAQIRPCRRMAGRERRDGMFAKGDWIVYGNSGVCEVKDITTLNMKGVAQDRLYYLLSPCHRKDSKIFTPVESDKTVMRAVLTREEADTLIDSIPEIDELRIGNYKFREEKYKETVRSCDCRDWVRIIKTLYMRKEARMAQGKKTTAMDERYLRMAEDNLYSELSLVLGIPKEEMEGYITQRVVELAGK